MQANWSRSMIPILDWLLVCGKDVPGIIKNMEVFGKVQPGAFKLLEAMYDPADYRDLALIMKDSSKKNTVKRMQDEAKKLIRKRYWTWMLYHPDLSPAEIHKSRSMLRQIFFIKKFCMCRTKCLMFDFIKCTTLTNVPFLFLCRELG